MSMEGPEPTVAGGAVRSDVSYQPRLAVPETFLQGEPP